MDARPMNDVIEEIGLNDLVDEVLFEFNRNLRKSMICENPISTFRKLLARENSMLVGQIEKVYDDLTIGDRVRFSGEGDYEDVYTGRQYAYYQREDNPLHHEGILIEKHCDHECLEKENLGVIVYSKRFDTKIHTTMDAIHLAEKD